MDNSFHSSGFGCFKQDQGVFNRLRMSEQPVVEPDPIGIVEDRYP
jgi:hypothetical protein